MTLPAIFDHIFDPLAMYGLATVCRANYNPSDAVWQLVGNGLRRHLQRAEIVPGVGENFPAVTVLFLAEHQVIVINGSGNLQQWVSSIINMLSVTLSGNPDIFVGTAFWTYAQQVGVKLAAAGVIFSRPTIIVGHSLGGAIAACLNYLWPSLGGTGQVVTVSFGAPRVGSKAFNSRMAGVHCRVVHNADIVTQLPQRGAFLNTQPSLMPFTITNYQHGGLAYWINAYNDEPSMIPGSTLSGREMVEYWLQERVFLTRSMHLGSLLDQANDHKLVNYMVHFRRRVKDAPRFTLEGFDGANTLIGVSPGEVPDWVETTLEGVSRTKKPLPEDPPELLPFPAPAPVWNPAAPDPLPPVPVGGPRPPTPAEIRERQFRHRRNF